MVLRRWLRPLALITAAASLLLLDASAYAQTPSQYPVSGNISGIAGSSTDLLQAKFALVNCGTGIPVVVGTTVPAKTTATLTANSSGLVTGALWGNDAITCNGTASTLYQVTYLRNNVPASQPVYYRITSAFDLTTATAVTVLPPTTPLASGLSCPQGQAMVGVLSDFQPVCQFMSNGMVYAAGTPPSASCTSTAQGQYFQTDATAGRNWWACFDGTWIQQGAPAPAIPGVTSDGSNGMTVVGNVSARTSNGEQIAGHGSNTTIQAAVTAGGSVRVPAVFPAGEMAAPASELASSGIATSSYTNYGTVPVTDLRPLNHDTSLAQLADAPALDDEMEGGDMTRAAKCIQARACKIALVGNSIHENISGIAPDDGYFQPLVAALQRKFPSVTWTAENLSIGGASVEGFNDATYVCNAAGGANTFYRDTPGNWYLQQTANSGFVSGPPYYQWPNGCTPGASWKSHVAAFNPDIVILGFVENEYGSGSGAYSTDLYTAIQYVQALSGPSPTVVLTTDEPPNPAWFSLTGADPAIFEGLNEATRGLALRFNLLLADADRYYNVLAYGVDPARRHFQVEHAFGTMSGISYPSGWSGEAGYTGTMPALTGSGGVAALLTFNAGKFQMIQRSRNATDFTASASFGGLSSTSVPSMWYRMDGSQFGYKIQDNIAPSGSNFVHNVTLYYSNGVGGTQQTLASGSCTFSSSTDLAITVEVKGTRHRVWCNTPLTNNYVKVIDTWDYQKLNAGALAIGVQGTGGTVSNQYAYYGNPTQYFTPLVSIPSMLGLNAPPNAYSGTGDFDTNPFSFGGDGLHHPDYLGMDSYYLTAFRPVIDQLSQLAAKSAYVVTSLGHTGPYGGLQDSQAGHVDFVNGANGGRIVNNANNTVLESWDDATTNPHTFNRPISATAVTDTALTAGDCVQAGTGGLLATPSAKPCALPPTNYWAASSISSATHIEAGNVTLDGSGNGTVTFGAAYPNHYSCGTSIFSGTSPIKESNTSTSQVQFTGTAGDTVYFVCFGY